MEKCATKAIEELILEHDLLDEEITYNDKTESFDGIIKIYKNEKQTKESMKFVDVQVKGLNDESKLKKQSFKYQIETKDLENYYNRRGAIFFVVVISDDKKEKVIFYNDLTPLRLHKYLKKHKKTNKPSIEMKRLKKQNKHELYAMLLNFIYDLEHQGAKTLNGDIVTLPIESKSIETVNFKYITTDRNLNLIDIFKQKDNYTLYGTTKEGFCVPITFDNIIESCITYSNKKPIIINNKTYYEEIKISEESNGGIKYIYSENLYISMEESVMKYLEFKAVGTIDSILNDLEFLLEILKYSKKSNSIINKEEVIKKENEVKALLTYFKDFEAVFKQIDIKFEQKYCELKENELNGINRLIDINNNIYIIDSKDVINVLKLNNKFIPIYIETSLNNKKSKIYNVLSSKMEDYEDTIGQKIPFMLYLDENILSNLYYINFNFIKRRIETLDLNEDDFIDIINNFLLNVIKCYDKTKNDEYLNLALILAEKMYKKIGKTYSTINYFQVLKRMDKLTNSHYQILENLLCQTKEETLTLGINILLENKYDCKKIISNLSEKDLNKFKKFPIYNLYKKLTNDSF